MGSLLVHAEEAGGTDIVLVALLIVALLAQATHLLFQRFTKAIS
jgi:ABC-type nitrate/sulfonate/bicarbonate transport system permease component